MLGNINYIIARKRGRKGDRITFPLNWIQLNRLWFCRDEDPTGGKEKKAEKS